ncbi:gag/pol protein [Gossypium australe]|uniref:Gag/pol protein n=1 Tax=Gossypium australe TaxID=47621 RepID=A0A5B6WWE9_9ROSI|nr:gag/pol protein [Gossypium australe]
MLKSIIILLSLVVALDYEIWQMDVKTIFLNDYLEESTYMMQPIGFIAKGNKHKVCKLLRSIYRLKQTSRSWNQRFDQVIKTFLFEQNIDEPCVYKCLGDGNVNDILLIRNDVGTLSSVQLWHLNLKGSKEQNKILERYAITDLKKGNQPSISRFHLSLEDCPKITEEKKNMRKVPYASKVGSLMYAMLCTCPNICFVGRLVSQYQKNPGLRH